MTEGLPPKLEEVRQWLTKAKRDLGSARRLMEGDEPYYDSAVYHCQQAAEKALKAYMVFNELPFDKTHNLSVLITISASVDPGFQQLLDAGDTLTPYATAFRYPGGLLQPERDEAASALDMAGSILKFVSERVPGLSPQT